MDGAIGGYLTIFELSELTKFKVPTLRKYVLERTIPFHKINRAVRFKADEINAWIAAGGAAGWKKTAGGRDGVKPGGRGELLFEERA